MHDVGGLFGDGDGGGVVRGRFGDGGVGAFGVIVLVVVILVLF